MPRFLGMSLTFQPAGRSTTGRREFLVGGSSPERLVLDVAGPGEDVEIGAIRVHGSNRAGSRSVDHLRHA